MNRLLTPAEIAQVLGVKQSTIYQWTHIGFIPHVKLGRLLRFREATVLEWVVKREYPGRGAKRQAVRLSSDSVSLKGRSGQTDSTD